MIFSESVIYKRVWNAPKSIFKIKEGYVDSPLATPCIFDDLLHGKIVFYVSVYARHESFLHHGINEIVTEKICSETVIEQEVEYLPYASTEGDHAEVSGFCRVTFLVDGFDHRLSPR